VRREEKREVRQQCGSLVLVLGEKLTAWPSGAVVVEGRGGAELVVRRTRSVLRCLFDSYFSVNFAYSFGKSPQSTTRKLGVENSQQLHCTAAVSSRLPISILFIVHSCLPGFIHRQNTALQGRISAQPSHDTLCNSRRQGSPRKMGRKFGRAKPARQNSHGGARCSRRF
jgi:hypothetical protein